MKYRGSDDRNLSLYLSLAVAVLIIIVIVLMVKNLYHSAAATTRPNTEGTYTDLQKTILNSNLDGRSDKTP